MKILVSSDLHINSWIPFSKIDSLGRPSRLTDYLKLAKVMADLAKKEKCSSIILAGDISECSIQRPMVHDVIGDFLRILAESTEVHLIHGQHDCDSKEASSMGGNSILKEICKDLSTKDKSRYPIYYHDKPVLIELEDKSVYFQPWTENHELPNVKSDVFIGHGIVNGCTNLDGYVFMNGFKREDLFSKFKLSIIGDIHKRQLHSSIDFPGHYILQPGTPIQNSMKDYEDCGIYVVDIQNKTTNFSFYNIHDIVPDTFHRFTYDYEGEPNSLIHSRPKIKATKKQQEVKSLELERDNTLIYNTCIKLIQEDKEVLDKELVKSYLETVFSEVQLSSDKIISNTLINSIEAENFLSIDKVHLNFNEFPRSCVIVGSNGSGKTTIPEAIYWCLTGSTTKNASISDVINSYKNVQHCKVQIQLTINSQEFTVVRERDSKSSTLYLLDQDNNTIKRGSIRETQSELYRLLGLKEWQIFMFSYFSAEKTSIFAGLGDSAKNELVSQIVGLDFVESMREFTKDKRSQNQKDLLILEGSLREKESTIKQLDKKLEKLMSEISSNKPKIESRISNLKNLLVLSTDELKELESTYLTKYGEKFFSCTSDISEISKEYYSLQSAYEKAESTRVLLELNLNRNKNELKVVVSGKCPTCSQPVHDPSFICSLKEKISSDFLQLKNLPNLTELKTKLTELYGTLSSNEELSKNRKIYSNKLQSLQKTINDTKIELLELNNELLKESSEDNLIQDVKSELQIHNSKLESIIQETIQLTKTTNAWKYLETTLFKKTGELVKELNKQGSKLIQVCINEVIPNNEVKILIDRDLNLKGEFHNNSSVAYELMSSGQKRLTDIIMMVAINNLFSKIYNLKDGVLGLCVYDEILSFLDDKYIEIAKQVVDQNISKKLLVITHDSNLMNMYDSRIKVSMSSSGSVYKKSWE